MEITTALFLFALYAAALAAAITAQPSDAIVESARSIGYGTQRPILSATGEVL